MAANNPTRPQSCFDFEVFCPLDGSHLSVLRRFVTSVAQEIGFNADESSKIEMAVDEACSNVLMHAYKDNDQASVRPGIELRLLTETDGLTIQVQDHGCGKPSNQLHGMDTFEEYAMPNREQYHGLGILIMKEFMDEVRFISKPNEGTIVTMHKKIHQTSTAVN